MAAHNFSSKKLSFLNHARDAFSAALLALPQPYALEEAQNYRDVPRIAPRKPHTDHIASQTEQEGDAAQLPELDRFPSSCQPSDVKNSFHDRCDSGYHSASESSLVNSDIFPDYNKYPARQPLTGSISHIVSRINSGSQARDFKQGDRQETDLMPKPLFIKKRTSELIKSSTPRQLPDISIPPLRLGQRKTATHPPHNEKSAISTHNMSPILPSTKSQKLQQPNLTQPLLYFPTPTQRNTNLTTFRTQLSKHLTSINAAIATTTLLQQRHRLNQSKRLASFWSFKPVLSYGGADNGEEEEEEEEEGDAKVQERKERMKRLRASGWRVDKERYGWKGEGYYEELREAALADLS